MSSGAKLQRNNDLGKFFNVKSVGVAAPSLVTFSHADDADYRGDISHEVFPAHKKHKIHSKFAVDCDVSRINQEIWNKN